MKKVVCASGNEDYLEPNSINVVISAPGSMNNEGRVTKDEPELRGPKNVNIDERPQTNEKALVTPGVKNTAQTDVQKTPVQTVSSSAATVASTTLVGVVHARVTSLLLVTIPSRQTIALQNVAKPIFCAVLPKSVSRIKLTPQLAFAHHLLPMKSPSSASMPRLVTVTGGDVQEMEFDEAEEA